MQKRLDANVFVVMQQNDSFIQLLRNKKLHIVIYHFGIIWNFRKRHLSGIDIYDIRFGAISSGSQIPSKYSLSVIKNKAMECIYLIPAGDKMIPLAIRLNETL